MRIDSRPLLPSLLAMACGTTSSVASSKHHYNLRISHQCSHLPYFNVVLSSSQRRGKIWCKIKDNFPFQFVQALDNRGVWSESCWWIIHVLFCFIHFSLLLDSIKNILFQTRTDNITSASRSQLLTAMNLHESNEFVVLSLYLAKLWNFNSVLW